MHRPLREPLHFRIWRLVRGVFLYNTVYWSRASDGLNLPELTAEERAKHQPERNLEIIRPRMRPRAHLDPGYLVEISEPPVGTEVSESLVLGAEVSEPQVGSEVSEPPARAVVSRSAVGAEISEPPILKLPADEHVASPDEVVSHVYRTEVLEDGTEQVYVKRRRYRRRLVTRGSSIDRGGFFARVFGKK